MENILKFINELTKNNSGNYKKTVLEKWHSSKEIAKFLSMVYNPEVQYFIKWETVAPNKFTDAQTNFDNIISLLEQISARTLNREGIKANLEKLNKDAQFIVKQILDRKITNGNLSVKTINKVFANLIPTYGYMRCSNYEKVDNIKFPAISQIKMDGAFANLIVKVDGTTEVRTRQGKLLDIDLSDVEFDTPFFEYVLMGEMLCTNPDGSYMDRKTGNGLISKLAKKEQVLANLELKLSKASEKQTLKILAQISQAKKEYEYISSNIKFIVWDYVKAKHWRNATIDQLPYWKRLALAKAIIDDVNSDRLTLINSKEVNSLSEAKQHYREARLAGEEGTVLKNIDSYWKDGTSQDMIKFKSEYVVELLVTGFEYGQGAFEKGIGALVCQSSDGLLNVNVSGLTRDMRGLQPISPTDLSKGLEPIPDYDFDQFTGQIISVKFNEVLQDKDGNYSLFLPRFEEVRFDKSEADTLEYIINIAKVK